MPVKVKAIDPDLLEDLEMAMRSNEMEGFEYTDEEKEMLRSACTSEENLYAVMNDYLKKKIPSKF